MRRMASLLVLTFLLSSWLCVGDGLNSSIVKVKSYNKTASYGNSTLYSVQIDSRYDHPPLLIHLVGARHDMGYAYGYMLSDEIKVAYNSLMTWLLRDYWILKEPVEYMIDIQWNRYLSKQVPPMYLQELEGLAAGAKDNGCDLCGVYVTRYIVLANVPSDAKDMLKIFMREWNRTKTSDWMNFNKKHSHRGLMCSMFAVWGSRTNGSKLFSSRNLDWNPDTGVNVNKIVVVTVPNDGGIPSASVGFVGAYGTLAGMSASGVTVHEANLEEDQITFSGFPWILRLRYIMEYATDITSARKLWESTNNTVGYNHMISSGNDATAYVNNGGHSTVALVMETMYQYTAYFHDNDPREADALYEPKNGSDPVHIGYPLHEALWRTNHGYDPIIRQHFEWSQAPNSWSSRRYMFIHEAIQSYANAGVKIGDVEAVNITAIAGHKGEDHPYSCYNNTDGTNVLSVVYKPQDQVLYAAWERSKGQGWRPAVCSDYVMFELSNWFKPSPSLA